MKTILFSERDKQVFQTLIRVWDENEAVLPGGLNYQDVFDLCDKLGAPHPPKIKSFIAWAESKEAKAQFPAVVRFPISRSCLKLEGTDVN